jgi:hypothetical protein
MAARNRLLVIISTVFVVFFAALCIFYLFKDDSSRWQVSIGGIIVSALPLLLILLRKPFPTALVFGYFLFVFCSICLGSITSFYRKYAWWDTTLHLYKGIFVGIAAVFVFKLLSGGKGNSRSLLFLFSFSLSAAASILWEIYEFAGDQLVTETMQRGGNKDTMIDLIAGASGALMAGIYNIFRFKKL